MTDQTDIREFLHRMADETGFAPVEPRPVVRKARRRLALNVAGTLLTVGALVAGAVVGAGRLMTDDRPQRPAGTTGESDVPKVDYVIDLNTGEMTPLRLIRDVGTSVLSGHYAASPDGSLLAYVHVKENGSRQIFIVPVDGTNPRQVTQLPRDASPSSPAWSPDGSKIAYVASDSRDVHNLFVLDVATGESAQITDATRAVSQPQFMPDGSSLLYCGGSFSYPVLRSVPVAGGKGTVLFGRGRGGMADACNGSLSPDGSLVTMMGSEIGGGGALRFVANPDGTELRQIPGRASNPAGTWSPDGSRIVCSDDAGGIVVVDIATGDDSLVAEGSAAIWLDDHTLLVDVRGRS